MNKNIIFVVILSASTLLFVTACGDKARVKNVNAGVKFSQLKIPETSRHAIQLPDSGVYTGGYKNGLLHGTGTLRWRNGDVYEGEFRQGMMHGKGKLVTANGDEYTGDFANGMAEGEGEGVYGNGGTYKGEFKGDMFHGQGKYVASGGTIYEGDFNRGKQQGTGKILYKGGAVYTGEIKNWHMHGQGVYTTKESVIYSGEFVEDVQSGKGEIKNKGNYYSGDIKDWTPYGSGEMQKKDGSSYKGEFKFGAYDGEGELIYKNGNTYKGQFKSGMRHGEGSYTRAKPKGRKKVLAGWWDYDDYLGKEKPKEDKTTHRKAKKKVIDAEAIYYSQRDRLTSRLNALKPSTKNQADLYVVNFAGYGSQDVFMKEAIFSKNMFDNKFSTQGRSINLINNHKVVQKTALASVTNLDVTLKKIADLMNLDEDILFLYLTSHGSKSHTLSVSLRGVPLNDLPAKKLASLLKDSGIRWKVIVVSSCYSGGFITALKDEYTMVMAAAKSDHVSFGCSEEAEFTYFGRALLKQSIPSSISFTQAFDKAKLLVSKWEAKENYDHSQPQIWTGGKIRQQLQKWRNALPIKLQ